MRIVDQHKIYSVEFDDVVVVRNENVIMAESMYKDASYRLGTYVDEKRAIDVFGEIHKGFSLNVCNMVRFDDERYLDSVDGMEHMNPIQMSGANQDSVLPTVESVNAVFYMPRQ